MIADVVGRLAVRHLPDHLASIEVDRRQQSVRRLHERQPIDEHRIAGRSGGRRVARGGCRAAPASAALGRWSWRLCPALRRVGGAAEARAFALDERLAGRSHDVSDVRANSFGGSIRPIGASAALDAGANTVCVSGSYPAPGQLVPPFSVPTVSPASGPPTTLTAGGVNIGPVLYSRKFLSACSRISGVKSINSSIVTACRA